MSSSMGPNQVSSEYQANLEILMQIPLFSGLSMEPIKVLTYLCKRETFRPGDIIFHRHELDPNAYFIIDGKAKLILNNNLEEVITEFGPNDFIGGLSLFSDTKRLFTLKAESRLICLMLSRERFQKTLEQFPQIAGKMFESLVKSICDWEARFIGEHGLKCTQCRSNIGVSLI